MGRLSTETIEMVHASDKEIREAKHHLEIALGQFPSRQDLMEGELRLYVSGVILLRSMVAFHDWYVEWEVENTAS